ncbi:MAG: DUF262 domain-containing protein [Deltaproteobacteria bacterium]|nr:DUF262 domain-containing protein [Deltaproteobacteria bacterium]
MAAKTSSNLSATLGLKPVGEISGRFLVPAYQRGYRWGAAEVRALLDDIWANGDKPYCLQPVVVKHRDGNEWELIDGQQRLTTLFLVFRYMQREGVPSIEAPYAIHYETRARSEEYLRDLPAGSEDENIDFFHIHRAYSEIREWFERHGVKRLAVVMDVYRYLFNRVQVIWYEAPADIDGTTLFTRLNVGRIPLTNAELIKALLLNEDGATPAEYGAEIAAQWDVIERDLREPERWAFLTNTREEDQPTRIELLFDLLAGSTAVGKPPRYQTFEALRPSIQSDRKGFWGTVLDLHALILEWHEDRDLHHKVGYLISEGASLTALVADAKKSRRSAFQAQLDASISKRLNLQRSAVVELSYEDSPEHCLRLLRLMNVESVRRLKHSGERYSFRAHKREKWSLEHIHAQHADGLTKREQWEEWLRQHRAALGALPGVAVAGRDALVARIDASFDDLNRQTFLALSQQVVEFFTLAGDAPADALHEISNLALLSSGANSALGNAVFEVKRRRILELDRAGAFLPICTRRVFLKYYTAADAQQVHFWGAQDRADYLDAMLDVVKPYLTPETTS